MGPLSSARTHYANKCFAWYLSPYNQFVLKTGWVTRVSKPLLLDSAQKRVRDGLGTMCLILWQSGFCCHLEESVSILAQRAKSSCSPRITAVTLGSARPMILVLFHLSSPAPTPVRSGCFGDTTDWPGDVNQTSQHWENLAHHQVHCLNQELQDGCKEVWEMSEPLLRRHGR